MAELQKELPDQIASCFDMVAGTSTGSIVAMGVVNGIDINRVADLFVSDGPAIFSASWKLPLFGGGPKYRTEPLRTALEKVLAGKQLADSLCDVVVPAITLSTYECKLFSNLHDPNHDASTTAVDVALASSAAPTYFPSVKPVGSHRTYVDGGLFANDPSLAAAMMAHKNKDIAFTDMRIVRLGNGRVQSGMESEKYDSLSQIGAISPLFEMMFESQGTWVDAVLSSLCGKENLIRVNPELSEFVDLDDPEAATRILPGRAESTARDTTHEVLQLLGYRDPNDDGGMPACSMPPPQ